MKGANATWLLAACLVVTACQRSARPTGSIDVVQDTMVLYGTEASSVPVAVRDRDGRSVERSWLELHATDSEVVSVGPNGVNCWRPGVSAVQLAYQGAHATITAVCRPARQVAIPEQLVLGRFDRPFTIRFRATFETRRVEDVPPIELWTSDSSIVAVRRDSLVPGRVGEATIDVDVGGVRGRMKVQVLESIAVDTLALRFGEQHGWGLGPGHYTIRLAALDGVDSFRRPVFDGQGIRCVPSGWSENEVNCVVAHHGVAVLANTSRNARGSVQRVVARIWQWP